MCVRRQSGGAGQEAIDVKHCDKEVSATATPPAQSPGHRFPVRVLAGHDGAGLRGAPQTQGCGAHARPAQVLRDTVTHE